MSTSTGAVSIELYRLYEYSFSDIVISLYRFFKSYELEYDGVNRLVEDEDLFLSWAMSICSSENADLIRATAKLNGIAYSVTYSIGYGQGCDLYLPVPQLTRIKRVYLVRNDLSVLSGVVLGLNIQDSGVAVYDLSNEQLYAFASPVKLAGKSALRGIIVELQDSITFVPLEVVRKVKVNKRSRRKKRKVKRRRGRKSR
ncbi:MAG: hypothetical protein N3D82_03175 [Ignisphaera sp.]|nr:hypothetical protein [Ignisphaera sp.]MCX8168012.1 hypothetical protein [Ignisphaera sp.]MDW8085517.1 hypothetical protein [Ignisphaera sp.]